MFKFEELNVYQQSLDFVKLVYKSTEKWPRRELLGLTGQLRRAAVSIVLNIAEGTSRTSKDFSHFLSLARGSTYECVAVLTVAKNNNYMPDSEYTHLYERCVAISKMLSGLRKSLAK